MIGFNKKGAFPDFEKAVRSFPKSGGPLNILVLTMQGLPVLEYDRKTGASQDIDDYRAASVTDIVRSTFSGMEKSKGEEMEKMAFFFDNEVVTVEKDDPFIFVITWPADILKLSTSAGNSYLKRLARTLHEELT